MCSPIWRACVSDLTVFLEEENVSCLSRLAGSPRSRGGQVAQPTSGSAEADSPHLHQTAALFWHSSENWPWWSLMCGGMRKSCGCSNLCCSLVALQFERSSGCILYQTLLVWWRFLFILLYESQNKKWAALISPLRYTFLMVYPSTPGECAHRCGAVFLPVRVFDRTE